jgi:hypothetical protein
MDATIDSLELCTVRNVNPLSYTSSSIWSLSFADWCQNKRRYTKPDDGGGRNPEKVVSERKKFNRQNFFCEYVGKLADSETTEKVVTAE